MYHSDPILRLSGRFEMDRFLLAPREALNENINTGTGARGTNDNTHSVSDLHTTEVLNCTSRESI